MCLCVCASSRVCMHMDVIRFMYASICMYMPVSGTAAQGFAVQSHQPLTSTYCNTLQHTATHCNTLHYGATRCTSHPRVWQHDSRPNTQQMQICKHTTYVNMQTHNRYKYANTHTCARTRRHAHTDVHTHTHHTQHTNFGAPTQPHTQVPSCTSSNMCHVRV